MKNQQLFGIVFCLFAALSWGAMFPIMDSALQIMNPFMFTAIRYTFAAVILAALLYWKENAAGFHFEGHGKILWLLGSLGYAGFGFLVFLGQQIAGKSGAISASVFMALMPLLSVMINWLFRGVKPVKHSMWFILLSFIGVVLVVSKGNFESLLVMQNQLIANGLLLTGALCWVIYTVGAYVCPEWTSLRYTTVTSLLSVPTILGINIMLTFAGYNPMPTAGDLISIAPEIGYMVIVTAVMGVLAWNSGNKKLTPINGVLFINMVPITTFIITGFAGYSFSKIEIIGATITIAALILNNINQRIMANKEKKVQTVENVSCTLSASTDPECELDCK